MNITSQPAPGRTGGAGAVAVLALILALLFWRSFLPDYVHFSNDGPLGQQHTAAAQLPAAFFGTWNDNNDIGSGAGAWPLSLASLFRWAVGPLGYAKFLAPFALFVLGLGAWSFFRQLKLAPLAVTLGTLAAVLNSTFFAIACWGVAPQEIAIGMDFFALALVAQTPAPPPAPAPAPAPAPVPAPAPAPGPPGGVATATIPSPAAMLSASEACAPGAGEADSPSAEASPALDGDGRDEADGVSEPAIPSLAVTTAPAPLPLHDEVADILHHAK